MLHFLWMLSRVVNLLDRLSDISGGDNLKSCNSVFCHPKANKSFKYPIGLYFDKLIQSSGVQKKIQRDMLNFEGQPFALNVCSDLLQRHLLRTDYFFGFFELFVVKDRLDRLSYHIVGLLQDRPPTYHNLQNFIFLWEVVLLLLGN